MTLSNYYINVYHNPQLEQGSKEFWGQRKDISITAGKTTTTDFYRYNPYVDKFYAEKDSVEVNTPVKINVGIKVPSNCPDAKAYVKALVIIRDENGDEVYRKESDDREVQKGGSSTFSFSYTPAEEGTYSGLAKAYIVGGGELCTDNCGWMKVFTCQKEESDLIIQDITWKPQNPESEDPVDFTITVKNTGTKDVDSTIYVDFATGATQHPRKKIEGGLKSGETATVTYRGILEKYCLSYLAQATVDPDNTIGESDENNNYNAETVNIVKKYALIVGINKYNNDTNLKGSVKSANAFYNLLKNGYRYDKVIELTDSAATLKGIHDQLIQIKAVADSNDIFVFYFCGHGGAVQGIEYIEVVGADPKEDDLIPDFWLGSQFNEFHCTTIGIFGSCNSGGLSLETDTSLNEKDGINRDDAVVLMACDVEEDASSPRWIGYYDLYSYKLYKAFVSKRSKADLNSNQKISLEEAHNYAYKETLNYCRLHLCSQHPQIMDHYKSKAHPEEYCYFSKHPISPDFLNDPKNQI